MPPSTNPPQVPTHPSARPPTSLLDLKRYYVAMCVSNSPPSALRPLRLAGLTLRNRIVRAGCFEGLSTGGQVTEQLIEHHRLVAAGGVGMTTLSYCSVSYDGRAFDHELWMRPEILPDLQAFTTSVHGEGAAASIQLGHCGFFASPTVIGRRPLGPSPKFCLFRLSYCRHMTEEDIEEKIRDFVEAALLAREAGFNAIEIHAGHGYLLSQFLSPWTNQRQDRFGGPLENRVRFPAEVIRRVRKQLGDEFPILVKMNQRDGMKGGLELDEALRVARCFEAAGATALIPSCGFTSRTPLYMLRGNVPTLDFARAQPQLLAKISMVAFGSLLVQHYPFEPCFLVEGARRIRDAVGLPVGYVGGVTSLQEMNNLVDEGFAFVQIGRSTIRDPDFVNHLQSGELDASDCDHCNRCIASMSSDGVCCHRTEPVLQRSM